MILAERSEETQYPLQKGEHLGRPDLVSREYFRDPGRLADLLNAELFQGECRIRREDIRQRDPSEIRNLTEDTAICASLITRDQMGEIQIGLQVVLVALEVQTGRHYAMPLRVLSGDSAGYEAQWRQIADYPLHLIEVREYPRLERFHSDLRYVFGFLQRDREKDKLYQYVTGNRAAFSHLDGAAYQMIQVMSHSSGLLKEKEEYENEEGEIDMCQALLDMREECISIGKEKGREEGISIGREEGISIGRDEGRREGISIGKQLTKQVFRLLMAGKSEKEIAETCSISIEEVKDILS